MSFHLYDSYTFWVSRLSNALQERLSCELDTLDLTSSQWIVMSILSRGLASTPASIAEKMEVDRSAVSRLLDRLERKGLVMREMNDQDRRSVKIVISAAGKMMVAYMDQAAENHQQKCLSALSESEKNEFKKLVKKLLDAEGIDTFEWRS